MNDFFTGATSGDASVAGNYSPPNIPSSSDNLYFGPLGNAAASVTSGLAALAAVALGTLSFQSVYSGTVGLGPQVTYNLSTAAATGSGPYTLTFTTNAAHGYSAGDTVIVAGVDPSGCNGTWVVASTPTTTTFTVSSGSSVGSYVSGGKVTRLSQMQVEATICRIGDASLSGITGNGSGRLNLDFGSSAVAVTVVATAASGIDTGLEPVRLLFDNSSASLAIESGLVGIATNTPADVSTIGSMSVSGQSATLDVGPGVTFTTLESSLGTTNLYAGGGTSYVYSGSLNCLGNSALTTIYGYGGTITLNARAASGPTVTTLYLYGGTLDLTGNPSPIIISNIYIRDGNIKQAYVGQLTVTNWYVDLTDKTNISFARS